MAAARRQGAASFVFPGDAQPSRLRADRVGYFVTMNPARPSRSSRDHCHLPTPQARLFCSNRDHLPTPQIRHFCSNRDHLPTPQAR